MTYQVLASKKKEIQEKILSEYRFSKNNKATGVVCIRDTEVLKDILDGLSILPANFIIIHVEKIDCSFSNIVCLHQLSVDMEIGLDFMLCDNEKEKLDSYFKKGIVPILPVKNYMGTLLKEFNPVKSEGNSFLYNESTKWDMYYALTRYLENYKFPYDNRNLVKNIFDM